MPRTRTTRSHSRRVATRSSTNTPTNSTASPVFSANPSLREGNTESPPSSEPDHDLPLLAGANTVNQKSTDAKDVSLDENDKQAPRLRRNRAYVEITTKSSAKSKVKTPSSSPAADQSSPVSTQKIISGKRAIGKRKQVEYEVESCSEGDEQGEEDSGSEFEPDDDEYDEELMVNAAIEMSIQERTSRPSNGASGSKASSRTLLNPKVALRAAAAEHRIRRAAQTMDSDYDEQVDEDGDASDISLDSSDVSDEEIASMSKKKRKGKAKAVSQPAASRDNSSPSVVTLEDIHNAHRSRTQRRREQAALNRRENAALRKKLGRKPTHAEKVTLKLGKHHPELRDVWGDLESISVNVPIEAMQPIDLKVKLLPFQRESLHWMRKQEQSVWKGGMLADEMGMGKTIQIISLLVADRQKPNLVVAPTVAVMQWKNELASHTEGMKVLVWHGSGRETDCKELKKYDVVLTTYAVLESCFRKQEKGFTRKGKIVTEDSTLHRIEWKRIVLDEAHNIKERQTNTAKAAFELKSQYKWCLSGTPLQNRVGELYSLIRFLGGDPFSYYFCKECECKSLHWRFINHQSCEQCGHGPMQHSCFWNNEILTPIQKHGMTGPGRDAFKKLKILLDRMMLRRTKIQKADDLGLPPRTVVIRRDYFSPEEKDLYNSLFTDAKRRFSTYLDQGTVLNNYSNIFSLLTRMRQMACHPDLVLRSKTSSSQFVENMGEVTLCRICSDIAEDAIQAKCRHIFDRECIKQYLEASFEEAPACPVCHVPMTIDLEAPALELSENVTGARQGILGRLNLDAWKSSTKIEALLEELSNLRLQDATTKSIVFSQFVNFLDLIAFRLQKAGFKVCRLEGTMTPQARDATIQYFMNNVDVTVFLVSLKAGGVALNLTEASRVYLCDSWWNPAVEFQAMDRIHRLGQRRPVQAIKLVVEDSIESRIVQLQEKKSAMINATLSTDESAMGRLTPQDLSFLFRL